MEGHKRPVDKREKLQVAGHAAQATGRTQSGDSDCGPEGRRLSRSPPTVWAVSLRSRPVSAMSTRRPVWRHSSVRIGSALKV